MRPSAIFLYPSRGLGSCCSGCAQTGGSCGDAAPVRVPGDQAFPVGFGQTDMTTAAADTTEAWAVPLAIGAISILAGFGLAYVIAGRK
jgi:hypothetical protein